MISMCLAFYFGFLALRALGWVVNFPLTWCELDYNLDKMSYFLRFLGAGILSFICALFANGIFEPSEGSSFEMRD
jgi:hypothetical protein